MAARTLKSIRSCGVALAVALGLAAAASAADLTVGAGSTLDLGTGSVALGCADLGVAGTLMAGTVGFSTARDVSIDPSGVLYGNSATLSLSGDWNNAGSFNRGTSTVQMVDGCALSSGVVAGNTNFTNLVIHTSTARQVRFTAGSTQTTRGMLDVFGAAGQLLQIRSTEDGSAAFLYALGPSSAGYVSVQDIDALAGNDVALPPNSVKGPNTPGWLFGLPVPMLAPAALALLALLLLVSGQRWLPGSTRADPG